MVVAVTTTVMILRLASQRSIHARGSSQPSQKWLFGLEPFTDVVRPEARHPRPCRNYLLLAAIFKGESQQSGRHPRMTLSLHTHASAHVESTTLSLHNAGIVPCLFELFLTFSVDPSQVYFHLFPL
jgi:hypothetical protein